MISITHNRMTKLSRFAICSVVLLLLDPRFAASLAAQSPQPPPGTCPAAQLSFSLDSEGGNFNGMSHSGTLLVLRNFGHNPCSVPGRPMVGFEDAAHHRLPISLEVPPGMHPGPVIPPVVIPPGAEVTSELRWVSGDAYEANNGVSPAFITLTVGENILRLEFSGKLFGPVGKNPTYSLTPFRRDPVYTPAEHLSHADRLPDAAPYTSQDGMT